MLQMGTVKGLQILLMNPDNNVPNIVIIAGNVVTGDPNTRTYFKRSRYC